MLELTQGDPGSRILHAPTKLTLGRSIISTLVSSRNNYLEFNYEVVRSAEKNVEVSGKLKVRSMKY